MTIDIDAIMAADMSADKTVMVAWALHMDYHLYGIGCTAAHRESVSEERFDELFAAADAKLMAERPEEAAKFATTRAEMIAMRTEAGKPQLYVYLLEQSKVSGYDTYDSAVAIAETKEAASQMHPREEDNVRDDYWGSRNSTWAEKPEDVTVTLLGAAQPGQSSRIVTASFNAG
jgi:hypothetical protein